MSKTILITGATDGIGLVTAKMLADQGHTLLLHGRSPAKLEAAAAEVSGTVPVETYLADLSSLPETEALAKAITEKHTTLDVVINNAGVLKVPSPIAENGIDLRFVVNTLAPYLLTRKLLPIMGAASRVVNLSSAAQAPVDSAALRGNRQLGDMDAYSQSKLAITMWSRGMADEMPDGPVIVAVNPGSLLASKMVKEGFGIDGNDLSVGADILCRAALSDEFASASGKYFDNDSGQFAPIPHGGQDSAKCAALIAEIDTIIANAA